MKILLAHNRYQFVAGEEVVVQAEQELLQANGHEVLLVEVDNEGIVGGWNKAKAAVSAIYSFASKKLLHEEIARFHPDIVHVHNFFPLLSPAVYDACRDAGVMVVQTLHNYRIVCPNAKLFRDGQVCEDCLGKSIPWPGIVHGCYRDSRLQSAVVATMSSLHQLRGTWSTRVDAYIALTHFQKEKMIQAGLPAAKIAVKPNFIFDPGYPDENASRGYALFVGRFWKEKGITTLIEAYVKNDLHLPLKIVGDGPLREALQIQVQQAGLGHLIEFMGWQEKANVLSLIRGAQFLIFPSVWYETFGLSVIEAFACSVPVLASRLGCMAEIVQDGVTGLHFEVGNSEDLADKINWAQAHPAAMIKMGQQARKVYETYYTPDTNYQQLIAIYQQLKCNEAIA